MKSEIIFYHVLICTYYLLTYSGAAKAAVRKILSLIVAVPGSQICPSKGRATVQRHYYSMTTRSLLAPENAGITTRIFAGSPRDKQGHTSRDLGHKSLPACGAPAKADGDPRPPQEKRCDSRRPDLALHRSGDPRR